MRILLAEKLLAANSELAEANRVRMDAARIACVNVLGSPGAGKTALLEALIPLLRQRALRVAVIEGDLATANDAARIERHGVPVVQINTEGGCHLDAGMVGRALDHLPLEELDLLLIENVGNLVCTAGFALGEHARVVVLSVTEGDDKVEKYPPMFRQADLVVLNKVDLIEFTNFSIESAAAQLARLAPAADMMQLSARTGKGLDACADWLVARTKAKK